jgi:hypothetical protein
VINAQAFYQNSATTYSLVADSRNLLSDEQSIAANNENSISEKVFHDYAFFLKASA